MLDFDKELNIIRQTATESIYVSGNGTLKVRYDELYEKMLDTFLVAYMDGFDTARDDLDADLVASAENVKTALFEMIEGKDFRDRLRTHTENGDIDAIVRLAETEMTRDLNAGGMDAAKEVSEKEKAKEPSVVEPAPLPSFSPTTTAPATPTTSTPSVAVPNGSGKPNSSTGAIYKTWLTENDDRVRDTHTFLEGVTLPINAMFKTYDGDSATAPGKFTDARNNVGCRCRLKFTRGSGK